MGLAGTEYLQLARTFDRQAVLYTCLSLLRGSGRRAKGFNLSRGNVRKSVAGVCSSAAVHELLLREHRARRLQLMPWPCAARPHSPWQERMT
jgi:hypothetical protein